jgi:hypothetical protein
MKFVVPHTASPSLVKILFGQSGCLPVGLGMSAIVDESSAVCNDSDESNLENLWVISSGG